jgi:predicted type IV restriction endonuclease
MEIKPKISTAILEVRNRIQDIRKTGRTLNLAQTKVHLIQPILIAMQWDCTSIDDVHPDYMHTPTSAPVSYALMSDGAPRIFVAVRAFCHTYTQGENVYKIQKEARLSGVKWLVFTNGDNYILYKNDAQIGHDSSPFIVSCVSAGGDEKRLSNNFLVWSNNFKKISRLHNRLNARWLKQCDNIGRIRTALSDLIINKDKEMRSIVISKIRNHYPEMKRSELLNAWELAIETFKI